MQSYLEMEASHTEAWTLSVKNTFVHFEGETVVGLPRSFTWHSSLASEDADDSDACSLFQEGDGFGGYCTPSAFSPVSSPSPGGWASTYSKKMHAPARERVDTPSTACSSTPASPEPEPPFFSLVGVAIDQSMTESLDHFDSQTPGRRPFSSLQLPEWVYKLPTGDNKKRPPVSALFASPPGSPIAKPIAYPTSSCAAPEPRVRSQSHIDWDEMADEEAEDQFFAKPFAPLP